MSEEVVEGEEKKKKEKRRKRKKMKKKKKELVLYIYILVVKQILIGKTKKNNPIIKFSNRPLDIMICIFNPRMQKGKMKKIINVFILHPHIRN